VGGGLSHEKAARSVGALAWSGLGVGCARWGGNWSVGRTASSHWQATLWGGSVLPRWAGPVTCFPIITGFSNLIQTDTNCKIQKGYFLVPKFSKLCKVGDKFKRNNFPFGNKFKFETEFELKFRKPNKVEFALNFKRVQTFEEKFHNFTKILS
jgi:hypothetical protein